MILIKKITSSGQRLLQQLAQMYKSTAFSVCSVALLLLGVNYPLILGEVRADLIFFPDAVLAGKWWLIFTHPLVHLSWYHLLLDGLAFAFLFNFLEERKTIIKLGHMVATGSGALLFALLFEPEIAQRGLGGLSGIAHGLMAISAFEMLRKKELRKIGLLCLITLLMKCVYELVMGRVFLESLHFGMIGEPVVACHSGGVFGGMISYLTFLGIRSAQVNKQKAV